MKPEYLEFYGVKSYTDTIKIDFSALLKNGLFGIFGNTGSGKSTILDCIFLALYGRLPKTDGREDYINTKTGKCRVVFRFSVLDGGMRKYYEVMRESELKKDRKIAPSPKAKLYEIIDGEKQPVSEDTINVTNKIIEIIGLNLNDFQKCIVLPQGEFSAFVNLSRSNRLLMVGNLFNLDRYGDNLYYKVKEKKSYIDQQINEDNAKLSSIEPVEKEDLIELESTIAKVKSDYDIESKKLLKMQHNYEDFKKLYDAHKKLSGLKSKLSVLSGKADEIKWKQSLIDRIDDAVTYINILEQGKSLKREAESRKRQINGIESEIKNLSSRLDAVCSNLSDEDELMKRVYEIEGELALLANCKIELSDCDKIEADLNRLRNEYSDLLNKIKKGEQKKVTLEKSLEELRLDENYKDINIKINTAVDVLVKSAQTEFIADEIDFLRSIEVAPASSVALSEHIRVLTNLKTDNAELSVAVKSLNQLYLLVEKFNAEKNIIAAQISATDTELASLNISLSAASEKGKILRSNLDRIRQKFSNFSDCKDLDNKILSLKAEKSNIETSLKTLKNKKESLSAAIFDTKNKLTLENAKLSACEDKLKAISDNLSSVSDKFADVSEAAVVAAYAEKKSALRDEVMAYDRDMHALAESIKEEEAVLSDADLSALNDETDAKMRAVISDSDEKIKNLSKQSGIFENQHKNLSLNFQKRCTILKELFDLNEKKKVIDELHEAVRNRKLLEYVAEEYLNEIALDAKSILLDLTGGKFGLVYQGDFYIEDFYMAGERRRTDTVSGGELFLISLSLALSLSKYICAKSSRPMEFFFLDEGFGSLDKELLEAVVDCLEKLRVSDFCIGVISHVEALKERIPARINVRGANDTCGSLISITD